MIIKTHSCTCDEKTIDISWLCLLVLLSFFGLPLASNFLHLNFFFCLIQLLVFLRIFIEKSALIFGINPPLIQIHKKHQVISKTGQPVHGGHANNKRKQVVYKSVQRAVAEPFPREVRHAFQLVVDEQLRAHQNKTTCVDAGSQSRQDVAVPPFMTIMLERVSGVPCSHFYG